MVQSRRPVLYPSPILLVLAQPSQKHQICPSSQLIEEHLKISPLLSSYSWIYCKAVTSKRLIAGALSRIRDNVLSRAKGGHQLSNFCRKSSEDMSHHVESCPFFKDKIYQEGRGLYKWRSSQEDTILLERGCKVSADRCQKGEIRKVYLSMCVKRRGSLCSVHPSV